MKKLLLLFILLLCVACGTTNQDSFNYKYVNSLPTKTIQSQFTEQDTIYTNNIENILCKVPDTLWTKNKFKDNEDKTIYTYLFSIYKDTTYIITLKNNSTYMVIKKYFVNVKK